MDKIIKTSYPLSFGQQAMWFIYQIDPKSVVYNMFTTVKINSYLNIVAANRVWEKIIEHHSILRTTYTSHEGKPLQQINQQDKFNFEVIDASNWSEDYLQEKIFAITDCPFNLEKDSVLRVNLFTCSAKEHILLLTMHHIAGDMWSFDILLSEFQALYANEIEQVSQEQTEAAADFLTNNKSYLEFVRWQSQMLSSSRGEEQRQYWREQLAGELPILNLLADKPRPTVQTYQGTAHILKLDEELIQKLRYLAQASGTTLYQILLTAFYVQLYRYTNQKDILIGSPMRGRWGGDFKKIVGYFVNLTVLRTFVQGNATFTEFLAQVSNTVKAAQKHQDYPFSLLAEQLQPQRDPSRSPLCQVSFTWQRQRWCEPTENSLHSRERVLQMEPYLLGHQRGADLDLNLMVMEAQGVLQLCWQYNPDLFEATTIARMAGHFVTLLEGIVANPQQRISQLPLLSPTEYHQLLVEWNDTQVDYPQDKCIHQLFEEQVARTPDAVAVVFENEQLTYHQLNTQANQLAHYLRSLGVGADVLVGLCVERSLLIAIALLAILKAGGAYVPLDPEYPTERLSYILEDTQVPVLLTQKQLLDKLPPNQAKLVFIDEIWSQIGDNNQENLTIEVTASHLANVIYTSGSTGKPKGVMVEHKGLCNLAQAQIQTFGVDSSSRVLQFASFNFDASIWEVIMALGSGATLYLGTKDSLMPGMPLIERLRDHSITHVTLPPSALAVLPDEELKALQTIIVAGEASSAELIKQWSVGRNFFNAYGPTEASVCATIAKCTLEDEKVTIGRPIANTQIYILDSHLQPVPIGVPGELHIGGAGLARGYLNRPELTNEKFISNPFSDELHSRLYKTGDLARYLPDANIEYLGRIDNQVKIRGFRIELGEIEGILTQHPFVQEGVVVARVDNTGEKRTSAPLSTSLVAYLVPALKNKVLPQQLAQWQSEYVSDWQRLYEQAYGQPQASADDVTFNISGWNSSYTKQPIPDWEMQEWVENTVGHILSMSPQRVLEIGCGTGLLLSRVAPNCQEYWGCDYSSAVIQHVEQVCKTVAGLDNVRLLHQMADNFADIPKGKFNTVVVNSVVQYFPSVEYLLQVLDGAIASIGAQGTLFVGDVRSLPLLEPFHASVQLSQAPQERSIEQWQRMVHSSVTAEEELLIDPSFFIALKQRFPQITWVEIQPKRGYAQNELTQFRYDVTLHVGADVQAITVPWLNWQLDKLSFTQIQHQLQQQPELLGIRGVPNQRVQQALQIWQWLENSPDVETVGQLRQLLAQQPTVGVNPEQIYQLGQQLGYSVHLSWWQSSQDGSFDVVFCRHKVDRTSAFWDTKEFTTKPWTDYTNNPLHGKLVQKLVPQVREYLQQKLPDYMMPSAFVLLDALPLTPNGKVDRRSLPSPDTATRNLSTGFVLPRTPIEAQITQMWSQVLGVARIGINDNFFELGGHSLLATQVLSEINSTFGLDLSIQTMFESPTVAGIAAYIEVVNLVTQLSIKEVSSEVVEF
ncbi:amino acid adenylation domain-containing protein [Nostoc sp. UHCC 0251]|uniref:amino acid adenylation domain-containing protein n=1 Tax=Nostoc sp. UHCC 0251 TaxID=3110240 RepID=UPI002B20B61E|nr:amino acid adenylation domain-containing protein [Nostoc sp. UHCC 0251]MEA5623267.1 amino acid adenylation domain-containing protein [Nostoc sp. UHCC 0251]